jgi:hypothetical protein
MAKKKEIVFKSREEASVKEDNTVNEVNEISPTEEVPVKKVASSVEKRTRRRVKKSFDLTDKIKCHSITQGGLYVDGPKTKQVYSFSDYDDVTEIEYRDLEGLVKTKSPYIYHPYFLIDDPDFVAEFPNLDKFYSDHYDMMQLESILNYPVNIMMDKIKKLPDGAAENLRILAASKVANGQLDSVRKIKALNEFFEIDLDLVAELYVQ